MPLKLSSLKAGAGHATRLVWVGLGLVALLVSLIGVFLPILPTTPLILLAAFAFTKGSPRLRMMLERHHIFGPIIADWEENGAIAERYKIMACSAMVATFLISLLMGVPLYVLGIQAVCLGAAALFVLTRPN